MHRSFGYKNKRVIVTGCASGIGLATTTLLVELGAEVHGFDINPGPPGLASCRHVDLRDPHSIDATVAAVGGAVHGLFNCAGSPPGPSALDVMKVNFIGTRHLTERASQSMPHGGAIVNVASNGGAGWASNVPTLLGLCATKSFDAAVTWFEPRAESGAEAYRLSKEAVIAWTLTSAVQFIQRGIRMNCTMPGAVQTPMLEEIEKTTPAARIDEVAQPIGRRSTPEEQAWPLIFLNSDAASYLNGAILPVDGGFLGAATIARFRQ